MGSNALRAAFDGGSSAFGPLQCCTRTHPGVRNRRRGHSNPSSRQPGCRRLPHRRPANERQRYGCQEDGIDGNDCVDDAEKVSRLCGGVAVLWVMIEGERHLHQSQHRASQLHHRFSPRRRATDNAKQWSTDDDNDDDDDDERRTAKTKKGRRRKRKQKTNNERRTTNGETSSTV